MRRLTTDQLASHPALSKEGNLIAYASDRSGRGDLDLFLQPVNSKDAICLTDEPGDQYEPAISPGASLIAYRSDQSEAGIYTMPLLGGGKAQLVAPGGRRPRFSPDGTDLAYSVSNIRYFLNVPGSGQAFTVPVRGGQPRRIAPDFISSHFPIFSPDGQRILFLGQRTKGKPETFDWWIVPAQGGEPVQTGALKLLAASGLRGGDFRLPTPVPDAWTASGVLFSARWDEETNLWRLQLSPKGEANGKPERVTLGVATVTQPAASDTGRLVFSTAVPNGEIYTTPLDAETGVSTGPLQPIAPNPASDHWPSVTADGSRIVFHSSRRGSSTLYSYDVTTSQVSELLTLPKLRAWSEISRDGTWLAYHVQTEKGYDGWERPIQGGTPERLCTQCQLMGRTRDRRTILSVTLEEPTRIVRTDAAARMESVYARSSKGNIYQPMLSPDERLIAFQLRLSSGHARICLAPWGSRSNSPETEWLPVTDGSSDDTTPVWSPEGHVLYFASNRDGFTCIYGQKIKGGTELDGSPFAVRHFHSAAQRAGNLGVSFRGLGIAANKMVLMVERREGNIWLLEPASSKFRLAGVQ